MFLFQCKEVGKIMRKQLLGIFTSKFNHHFYNQIIMYKNPISLDYTMDNTVGNKLSPYTYTKLLTLKGKTEPKNCTLQEIKPKLILEGNQSIKFIEI